MQAARACCLSLLHVPVTTPRSPSPPQAPAKGSTGAALLPLLLAAAAGGGSRRLAAAVGHQARVCRTAELRAVAEDVQGARPVALQAAAIAGVTAGGLSGQAHS